MRTVSSLRFTDDATGSLDRVFPALGVVSSAGKNRHEVRVRCPVGSIPFNWQGDEGRQARERVRLRSPAGMPSSREPVKCWTDAMGRMRCRSLAGVCVSLQLPECPSLMVSRGRSLGKRSHGTGRRGPIEVREGRACHTRSTSATRFEAVPIHKGIRLTERLLIVEAVNLQDDLRPVGTLRGRDEAYASPFKRRSEREVPSKDHLSDNPGKGLEPRSARAPTHAKLHLHDFAGYRELIHR